MTNIDRKEVEDAKKAKEIIESTTFVELPDPFEQEIVDNLFTRTYSIKKPKHPYVEPHFKDAQTVETETQATNSEFSKLSRNLIRLTMQ